MNNIYTYKQLEKDLKGYEKLIKKTWELSASKGDDYKEVKDNDKKLIILNNALDEIMYDRFYPIIELFYLQNKSYKEVESEIHYAHATISKQKSRLLMTMLNYIDNLN